MQRIIYRKVHTVRKWALSIPDMFLPNVEGVF